MAVNEKNGKRAVTHYRVLKRFQGYTYIECVLETGRTHQIRVHLASSGYVIAGDEKYGDFELNRQLQKGRKGENALKRMFLHAYRITFIHPDTGKPMTITAPLPGECSGYLNALEAGNDKDS